MSDIIISLTLKNILVSVCSYSAGFVLFCKGTMVTQFVEGWDFVQTLGEGAYGEYVYLLLMIIVS